METMKEAQTRTLVLEKETEDLPSAESFIEEKKESAKKVLFENNSSDVYMENLKKNFLPETKPQIKSAPVISKIEFEAEKTFYSEIPEIKDKLETEIINEPQFEDKVETNLEQTTEIEQIYEEAIEQETEKKPLKRAKPKTRFKIFVFALCAVLACMSGWAIYNSVQIKTLTAEMEQANQIYSVNVYNYIKNISKADDLTNPDSIFDLNSLSDANVVPIQPTEKTTSEYSTKSNWFDRFCNWLSNLFN